MDVQAATNVSPISASGAPPAAAEPVALVIEIWPIERVKPYPGNPRKITDKGVAKVATSIQEFGWRQPIVVDTEGVIICGHTRYRAAQKLELKAVPVHVAADLSPERVAQYRLADNKSAEESDWDDVLLHQEFERMREQWGMTDFASTGFDNREWRSFFDQMQFEGDKTTEAPAAETPAAEPPKIPITRHGDLWQIGPHRLLCGDARSLNAWWRLMAERKAQVIVTSPPYARQRTYDAATEFEAPTPENYAIWLFPVTAAMKTFLNPAGSYFLNLKEHSEEGQRHLYVKKLVIAHVEQWGWRFVDEFCWRNTRNGVPGRWANRCKNAWEPVFHFALDQRLTFRPDAVASRSQAVIQKVQDVADAAQQARRKDYSSAGNSESQLIGGGKSKEYAEGYALPSNVVEAAAEANQPNHPAPYPVMLPEFFILLCSEPDQVVVDPFAGSGTTLVAAHKTGRIGYGLELSPRYVDVAVTRLVEETGKDAIRVEDGASWKGLVAAQAGLLGQAPVVAVVSA